MLTDEQISDLRYASQTPSACKVWVPQDQLAALLSAHADAVRLRKLLDEVARNSTHPVRDGPGCWWCIAEDGEPHEPGCKYADALRPAGQWAGEGEW